MFLNNSELNDQVRQLARNPHVIVASPGRLFDHLRATKGFNINRIQFLVLDEADQLLNQDFQDTLDAILSKCPKTKTTFLFSATMTEKVSKLQRAHLKNPVRVSVASKFSPVSTLSQKFLLVPIERKLVYLVALLDEQRGKSAIIFTRTCPITRRVGGVLSKLGFAAEILYGQMDQPRRLEALRRFRSGEKRILVATDVASRGLDIPLVDIVIIYDLPQNAKTYMHRVGRTARAGRQGTSYVFVTQYDIQMFRHIEESIDLALKQNAKETEKKDDNAEKKKNSNKKEEDDEEDEAIPLKKEKGSALNMKESKKSKKSKDKDDEEENESDISDGETQNIVRTLASSASTQKKQEDKPFRMELYEIDDAIIDSIRKTVSQVDVIVTNVCIFLSLFILYHLL